MHTGDLFDYGPKFDEQILTIWPPRTVGTPYSALVPKTDADGNDIAGVRLPDVAVPLATYAGWNLRAMPAGGDDDGCDHAGSLIPFAKTKTERLASGDGRLSIEERYATHADYVAAVASVAHSLAHDRLLLDDDVQNYITTAQAASVP
jgi:hypothetical protein